MNRCWASRPRRRVAVETFEINHREKNMKIVKTLIVTAVATLPLICGAEGSVSKSGDAGMELSDIIAGYAKRSGKKFIVDPRVRAMGGLVGIDADKITYEQLLALAWVHQFVMVTTGDVTVVVPDANARQMPTPVYTDAKFKALDDEWVTLLLTAKNACTPNLVPILRPLMPQAAHLAANPYSNQIVVSDRAVNVRRIAGLIDRMDAAAPGGRGCQDWPPAAAQAK
jgi:general secretion pathway protein D